MPITKRKKLPTDEESLAVDDGKLHIVAKPKKPMPESSAIQRGFGDNVPPDMLRRIGPIARSCGDLPDAKMELADLVTLMRTPYDNKNPQELRYRARVKNRATAITAMCVVCTGGRKAVTECIDTTCPLWAFRFGGDPFYGKRT